MNPLRKAWAWLTDQPMPKDDIFLPLAKLPKESALEVAKRLREQVQKDIEKITGIKDMPMEKPKQPQYFKSQLVEDRAKYLNLQVYDIMYEMIEYIQNELKLTPCVTETVTMPEEDKALGRKSTSHQEGRAFDLRTRDWNADQLAQFIGYFNAKYESLGALNSKGEVKFIVYHNSGHGDHFHVQFNRSFSTLAKEGKLA